MRFFLLFLIFNLVFSLTPSQAASRPPVKANSKKLAASTKTSSSTTLTSFSARRAGSQVVLSWALAPAAKVSYVVVQHRFAASADWAPLATRDFTGARRYQYQNTDLPSGAYRLVTIGSDGSSACSPVLMVM
jgi:hypothetical protein